jgi:hypothetical protein
MNNYDFSTRNGSQAEQVLDEELLEMNSLEAYEYLKDTYAGEYSISASDAGREKYMITLHHGLVVTFSDCSSLELNKHGVSVW